MTEFKFDTRSHGLFFRALLTVGIVLIIVGIWLVTTFPSLSNPVRTERRGNKVTRYWATQSELRTAEERKEKGFWAFMCIVGGFVVVVESIKKIRKGPTNNKSGYRRSSMSSMAPPGYDVEDRLIHKFEEKETQYRDLKARIGRGEVTSEQAKSESKNMMILDETGIYWMMGGQTGKWYKHINNQWQEANPYEEINAPLVEKRIKEILPNTPHGAFILKFFSAVLSGENTEEFYQSKNRSLITEKEILNASTRYKIFKIIEEKVNIVVVELQTENSTFRYLFFLKNGLIKNVRKVDIKKIIKV